MTDQEWALVMTALDGAWPDAEPLRPDVEAFWRDQLEELGAAAVLNAVRSLMREGSPFRPTVGQIYRRACDRADNTPDWDMAWKEIRSRAQGNAGRPAAAHPWSHPLIQATVEAFGWADFCASDRDDEPAVRAQMRGMFESISQRSARERREGLAVVIGGLSELVDALSESVRLPEAELDAEVDVDPPLPLALQGEFDFLAHGEIERGAECRRRLRRRRPVAGVQLVLVVA
jgi:hypothetical protein